MSNESNIKRFEKRAVRTAWDEEKEEWYFSIVDAIGALTDQQPPRSAGTYWAVLKNG